MLALDFDKRNLKKFVELINDRPLFNKLKCFVFSNLDFLFYVNEVTSEGEVILAEGTESYSSYHSIAF